MNRSRLMTTSAGVFVTWYEQRTSQVSLVSTFYLSANVIDIEAVCELVYHQVVTVLRILCMLRRHNFPLCFDSSTSAPLVWLHDISMIYDCIYGIQ